MVNCWECEAKTTRPVTVMVGTPVGLPRRLNFCPSCYQRHYMPLVAEASRQTTSSGAMPTIGR
jgi:hypothetical protein